jgi:hypothetical protein
MKLRTKIANLELERKVDGLSRKTKVYNFDTAKTVVVIWSSEEEEAFRIIQKALKEKNISLQSLYYNTNKKAVPEDINSFYKVQLNWLGFAKEGPAVDFLQKEPDILIDLSIKKQFPVEVLVKLSKAAFKVGYSSGENNPYDLNIDIHQKPEPNYLAEQIINYLNLINKKEA